MYSGSASPMPLWHSSSEVVPQAQRTADIPLWMKSKDPQTQPPVVAYNIFVFLVDTLFVRLFGATLSMSIIAGLETIYYIEFDARQ